ncbi:Maleate isomerase [Kitasatospora aureofaciens]
MLPLGVGAGMAVPAAWRPGGGHHAERIGALANRRPLRRPGRRGQPANRHTPNRHPSDQRPPHGRPGQGGPCSDHLPDRPDRPTATSPWRPRGSRPSAAARQCGPRTLASTPARDVAGHPQATARHQRARRRALGRPVDGGGLACLVRGDGHRPRLPPRGGQRLRRPGLAGTPAPVVTSAEPGGRPQREEGRDGHPLPAAARPDGGRLPRPGGHRGARPRRLEIADGDMAAHNRPLRDRQGLLHGGADAVVSSACVRCPRCPPSTEQQLGKPVVSAAICTTHQLLQALGLPAVAPGAGTCSPAPTRRAARL